MNTKARIVLILTLALPAGVALWLTIAWAAPGNTPLAGGSPPVVAYQGEVRLSGAPYTGNGYFKFAVVNTAGDAAYWSNDGTSTRGGEPTAAVSLTVSEGLFSVLLGDTTLGGMTQALTAESFSQPDRYLRVWFSASAGGPFSQLTPDTRVAAVPYALQAQKAMDADTVDGLHASQLGNHYQNVVVVAKSGSDYTSVQAAINSITDAAAENPYLVWVAPGVYSETVTMKPYVHLQGAGQEATLITSTASSTWPPTRATLVLASDISLRDLTLGNGGTGDSNTALLATAGMTRTLLVDVTARALGGGVSNFAIFLNGSGTGVTLQQVTVLAENASDNNVGLVNYSGAAAVLHGGTFTARGGNDAWGIFNFQSGTMLRAKSVTVLAEDGSNRNFGLYNYGGAVATLHGGAVTGRGGMQTRGIENANSGATLMAENVTALAENGSEDNYGLGNYDSAAATLRGGSFTARGGTNSYGISNEFNGATLKAESATALAENGSNANYGVHNFGGVTVTATVRGSSFTARGGTNAYGIYNADSGATLEAAGVTALAENGSDNYGLYNDSATATVDGSQFTGSSDGLYLNSGTVHLGVSQLDGGATRTSGTLTCFQVYNGSYVAYICP